MVISVDHEQGQATLTVPGIALILKNNSNTSKMGQGKDNIGKSIGREDVKRMYCF